MSSSNDISKIKQRSPSEEVRSSCKESASIEKQKLEKWALVDATKLRYFHLLDCLAHDEPVRVFAK